MQCGTICDFQECHCTLELNQNVRRKNDLFTTYRQHVSISFLGKKVVLPLDLCVFQAAQCGREHDHCNGGGP